MTKSRFTVSQSLAARGRPLMWANEQESAELSGYEFNAFKKALPELEARGFPAKNPGNRKRPVLLILKFWGLPTGSGEPPQAGAATTDDTESQMTAEVIWARERLREGFSNDETRALKTDFAFLLDDKAAIVYSRTGRGPDGKVIPHRPDQPGRWGVVSQRPGIKR